LNVRTLSPVVASHTEHRIERDAEKIFFPSLLHASAVIGSVSPGRLCSVFPVETSTTLIASWHAAATSFPSRDSAIGPPVWNTSRLDAGAYVFLWSGGGIVRVRSAVRTVCVLPVGAPPPSEKKSAAR
jgi:hypothetical protein